MKCSQFGCPMFRDTDMGFICTLVPDQLCESGECIGYKMIDGLIETYAGQIMTRANQIEKLRELKIRLNKSKGNIT